MADLFVVPEHCRSLTSSWVALSRPLDPICAAHVISSRHMLLSTCSSCPVKPHNAHKLPQTRP